MTLLGPVDIMKHIDQASPHKPSGTGWHVLGELELQINEEADGVVRAWIKEILGPLDVHPSFENRILKSAQDMVARARQNTMAASKFEHIHLLVFAPTEGRSDRHSWGFFRIEKFESTAPSKSSGEHAIEFYLYLEGQ